MNHVGGAFQNPKLATIGMREFLRVEQMILYMYKGPLRTLVQDGWCVNALECSADTPPASVLCVLPGTAEATGAVSDAHNTTLLRSVRRNQFPRRNIDMVDIWSAAEGLCVLGQNGFSVGYMVARSVRESYITVQAC